MLKMQGRKKQSFSDNVRWGNEWDSFLWRKYNLAKVTHYGNASLREGKPAVNIHSRLCNIKPGPHLCTTLKKKKKTHCVTLCARRFRSASFLTIARSPPRSEHCFRASVQLSSPGTMWKQRDDSSCGTPSFGQYGEAGGGHEQPHQSPQVTQTQSDSSRFHRKTNRSQNPITEVLCLF